MIAKNNTDVRNSLRAELQNDVTEYDPRITEIINGMPDELNISAQFEFRDDTVKDSTEELVLSFMLLDDDGLCGRDVQTILSNELDTAVSPGTVYPLLNRFLDADILSQQELRDSKEYTITDEPLVRETIQARIEQHRAILYLLEQALDQGG